MSKITLTPLANLQNETTAVNAINANTVAIAAAVDNTLSRDGTDPNTMGANLDMNSYRIINLPTAVSTDEPVTLSQMTSALVANGNINTGITGVPVSAAMQPVVNASTVASARSLLGAVQPGKVTMFPNANQVGGAWNLFDPYGTAISTSGTTTQGLQEAINYSIANGYALEVTGSSGVIVSTQTAQVHSNTSVTNLTSTALLAAGMYITTTSATNALPSFTQIVSVDSSTSITINQAATITGTATLQFAWLPTYIACTSQIRVPPCENWVCKMSNVNVTFQVGLAAPLWTFNSVMACDFSFEGVMVGQSFGTLVAFAPTLPVPEDGIITVTSSRFYFSNLVTAVAGGTCIGIDCSVGSFGGNILSSVEINGGGTGNVGIAVLSPGVTTGFLGNIIDVSSIHGCQIGILVGSNTTNAANLKGNIWRISSIGTTTASGAGVSTWGGPDIYQLGFVAPESGTLSQGVNFQSSSLNNQLNVANLHTVVTPFVNGGTGNIYTYAGNIYKNGTAYGNP